ncbi:Nn.00g107300.m01.CDS01 [Neocucurbitaria sp. VM-36]
MSWSQNTLFTERPARNMPKVRFSQWSPICLTAEKDCIWAEAPRRARKLRAPSRIAQVEQKIDSLVSSLVNTSTSRPSTEVVEPVTQAEPAPTEARESTKEVWRRNMAVAPGSWIPVPSSFEQDTTQAEKEIEQAPDNDEADRQYLKRIRSVHNFGDREETSQAPEGLFRSSQKLEAPIKNDLVEQILSSGEADCLLKEYRQMSTSFPFVILSPNISGNELHESRPMLLLAILTVASWKDHRRQMSLDTVYRNELATRTIIRPRRTLGLVQSVLVYLSWYHFVFSHKTQQIFFLHHLVIGLALDIGLHQDYQPLNFPQRPKAPAPPPQEQRERQRAFLGCYYLASMIAAGLQKPNLLRHTPHMTEWAQTLKRDLEYESDEVIIHLISLRQIDDQVQDTLFSGSAAELPLSDARTLMHVRFMEAQLDAWRRESYGSASKRLLELSSSFTDMLLHSVALRSQPVFDHSATTNSTHLKALLSALEAGKRFLDALLSFPAYEYHIISFSEWMRLPTVIMTVARLCMPTDAHIATGWDFKAAQDRVRLDLCLESLCYRMQSLSTFDKRKQPHPDFWYAMRFIIDLTKTWFIRKIRPEIQASASFQPTRDDMMGQSMSDMSGRSSGAYSTPSIHQAGERYTTLAGINHMGDINMDIDRSVEDDYGPFTHMKSADFDMEQFFDMGIWSDESYVGFSEGGVPF